MKGALYPCDQYGQRFSICSKRCAIFIAAFNPFGICQRVCDLNPENCGHCTEPLQCGEWASFWLLCEREWAEAEKKLLCYDPDPRGCEFCYELYKCEDCPQRAEQENACDYTGDECIDSVCRRDGCIGCEVLAPPPKEELKKTACGSTISQQECDNCLEDNGECAY